MVDTTVPRQKAEKWNNSFNNIKPLINYSSTSQPELLNALKEVGCSFYYEEINFFRTVRSGISAEGLFVADCSDNFSAKYIDTIKGVDVHMVTVNSIEKIQACNDQQYPLQYILRVAVSDDISDVGCTIKEASSIITRASEVGVSLYGLLVTCNDSKSVSPAVNAVQSLLSQASSVGMNISNVLIVGEGVEQLLSEEREEEKRMVEELAGKVNLYADASRFFTESAYIIYTHIIAVKAKTAGEVRRNLYYTDNGVYCSFYNRHIHNEPLDPKPIMLHDSPNKTLYVSTIFGPTCDSIDTLGNDFMLPEMSVGDWFKFENCGYLCSNFSSRFNGFTDPDILVL